MGVFNERKSYRPSEYGYVTDPLIDAMHASHWTVRELMPFSSDVQDFKTKLAPKEQGVIKRSILLTSQIEVAVKTYWSGLQRIFPIPEIGEMGATFGGVEVIHARAYSEILNALGFNDEFQAILDKPVISGRVAYLNKYNDKPYRNDHKNATYSLLLFTLFVENVSLFSQFFIILAFNRFKGGILKNIANVVQYTSKEENLHAEGGMALIKIIRDEYPEVFDDEFNQRVIHETQEALKAETALIDWVLEDYENDFLSKDLLVAYLKRRLNDSLVKIGFQEPFEIDPKLVERTLWMDDEVYASVLTDFFYKRPIDYQRKMKNFTPDELF